MSLVLLVTFVTGKTWFLLFYYHKHLEFLSTIPKFETFPQFFILWFPSSLHFWNLHRPFYILSAIIYKYIHIKTWIILIFRGRLFCCYYSFYFIFEFIFSVVSITDVSFSPYWSSLPHTPPPAFTVLASCFLLIVLCFFCFSPSSHFLPGREWDYKKLAHMIMGADKSPDVQLTSWRPRNTDDIVLVQVQRPENRRRRRCSSSLKPGIFETQ